MSLASFYHTNIYSRLSDPRDSKRVVPQTNSSLASSLHRIKRLRELAPSWKKEVDLLHALGDAEDKEYPLFRTATPPDSGCNLATFDFDLVRKIVRVFRRQPEPGHAWKPPASYWERPLATYGLAIAGVPSGSSRASHSVMYS